MAIVERVVCQNTLKTKKKSEETVEPSGPTFKGQPISEMSVSELDSGSDELHSLECELRDTLNTLETAECEANEDIERCKEMTGETCLGDVSVSSMYELEDAANACEALSEDMMERMSELENADDED